MKLTNNKGARASRPHGSPFSRLISCGQDARTPFLGALAALALPAALLAQPVVSNVAFVQQPDGSGGTEVVISYDLASTYPCLVSLKFSANNGTSFVILPEAISGAFGGPISPGTGKEIVWRIAEDLPQWNLATATARVTAIELVPIPLSITSNLPAGSVSETATQTFTFTFGEGITGWYGTYPGTVTDPTGPGSGSTRVFRGGGWFYDAPRCRSAQRNNNNPTNRNNNIGFRVLAAR